MSTELDWNSLSGLEEPTPNAPSNTRSFIEKATPKEKDPWDTLEGLPEETEKSPSLFNKVKEAYIENIYKYPMRATARNLKTLAAAPFKGIGDALVSFSNLGTQSQEGDLIRGKGTQLAKNFGQFLGKFGRENESFLKGEIEKYLGKSYSTIEESLTQATERMSNIFGQLPGAGMIIPAIMGGFLGQGAKEAGLSEDAQSVLELTGMLTEGFGKVAMKLLESEGAGTKLLNMLKKNPKATGELTGLAGVQLEAFNALSDAEKATYLKNLAEKEIQLRSGIKAEETAAKTLEESIAKENAPGPGFDALKDQGQGQGRSLQGRVTAGGEDIGVRPTTERIRPSATESNLENVLDRVHVNELGNKRIAGETLKNTVMDLDNARYSYVNDLYTDANALNANVQTFHPELAHQLQTRLDEIERIPHPSTVQQNLKRSTRNILNSIAEIEEGVIVGYRDINNKVLIDQIQSLRQIVDFDFEHGSPKNIFRPLIGDIQESVYQAAANAGDARAAQSLARANQEYGTWTREFNNDYINSYRDTTNQSYEQLLDKNLKPDHFNVVRNLAGNTENGREILGAIQREYVEKKLNDFVKNPYLVRSRAFRKTMTELESILTPEQLNAVRTEMESQVPASFRRTAKPKVKPEMPKPAKPRDLQKELDVISKDLKAAEKYTGKTTAKIRELSDTTEGVAQLKQDLSRTKNGEQIFNKLAKEKIQNIVYGGKIKSTLKGSEIYDILNQEKNYALIEAYTSPEEAAAALDMAEKLAKKKFTLENLSKISKKAGKYKLIHMLLF